MTSHSYRLTRCTLFAAIALLASAAQAQIVTIFDYTIPSRQNAAWLNTTADAQNDYFYASDTNTWNTGYSRIAGAWQAHGTNAKNHQQYMYRNLRDNGIIPAGTFLNTPTLNVRTSWSWGSAESTTNTFTYLGFLNEVGNGYLALLKRTGDVEFYEIANGISETWVKKGETLSTGIKQGSLNSPTTGIDNYLLLSMTISSGQITLKSTGESTGDTATVSYALQGNDTVYNDLTTLVIGAYQGNSETLAIRQLSVNATVIPESSTVSLVLASLLAAALAGRSLLRRRSRS